MKGRKPHPTAIKKLKGNPGHRPLNELEPKPNLNIPESPDGLDKTGKQEWKRITKHLYDLNMIADMDLAVVFGYCHSFEQLIDSAMKLKKTGLLIKAPSGYPIVNPLLSINNEAKRQMLKYAQELGLSVVQRSRLKIEQKPKEIDPIEYYANKKR